MIWASEICIERVAAEDRTAAASAAAGASWEHDFIQASCSAGGVAGGGRGEAASRNVLARASCVAGGESGASGEACVESEMGDMPEDAAQRVDEADGGAVAEQLARLCTALKLEVESRTQLASLLLRPNCQSVWWHAMLFFAFALALTLALALA